MLFSAAKPELRKVAKKLFSFDDTIFPETAFMQIESQISNNRRSRRIRRKI